ncbi:MAG: 4Fe-4S dicluster domain-containing protein, partial [Candidatus Izemoplasma sp.]
ELDSRVKQVFVNAMCQNEPFISTDYRFILDYYKAISDGVLLLGKGANTKEMYVIHDKFMPNESLELLKGELEEKGVKFISVDSKKVKAFNYLSIDKRVKGKLKTNLLDSGVLYVSAETAKVVSDCLRKDTGAFETHLTVTGEALNNNSEYIVKTGTLFEEVIEDLKGYQNVGVVNIHVGNYLSGTQVEGDSFSITETVSSINVSEYHVQAEDVCIKCGECNDVCPVGILPQNIMDAELREINHRIFDLHTDECIECGLCTYVCPSKINVLEWVRRAMRRTV